MRKRLYFGISLVAAGLLVPSLIEMNGRQNAQTGSSTSAQKPLAVANSVVTNDLTNRAKNVSAEFNRLNKLTYESALRCVKNSGVAVPPSAESISTGGLLRGGVSFATQADIDDRKVNGYRTWMTSKEREAVQPSQSVDSSEFAIAMNGEPSADMYHAKNGIDVAATGCLADARVSVFGSLENFAQVQSAYNSLAGKVQGEILSSDVMVSTQKEWSACMASAGFQIASWFDMTELLHRVIDYKNDSVDAVKAKDMEIAKADANCLDEVGYVSKMSSLPEQAENRVLSRDSGLVALMEDELSKVPKG